MSVLYFFESIRNPILDSIVSIITMLGEELVFLAIAIIIFWCIDKYQGYYLMAVGFIGTIINQVLKITFRIPRPWVLDKNFTIVESAREAATGYSFPSGHTQSSVGTFGALAKWNKNNILRILSAIVIILVPFSRMYLGVHTPKDVIVSFFIAIALVLILQPIINAAKENPKIFYLTFGFMLILALLTTLYVCLYNFPIDTDAENLYSAQKNAFKLLGCILGILLVYFVDSKYINFKTQAKLWVQIIKVVFGLALVLGVKEGTKPILNLIFQGNVCAYAVRYFLVVIAAGIIWPYLFTKFNNYLDKKKK